MSFTSRGWGSVSQQQEFLHCPQVYCHQQVPAILLWHLPSLLNLPAFVAHSWASGNMDRTLDVVSVFLAMRVHWSSLSHHNLSPPWQSILSSTLHLFPASHLCLIRLPGHCFGAFTLSLDLCGLMASVYLSSLRGGFGVGPFLLYSSTIFLSSYSQMKPGSLVNNPCSNSDTAVSTRPRHWLLARLWIRSPWFRQSQLFQQVVAEEGEQHRQYKAQNVSASSDPDIWVWIPAMPLTSCGTLANSLMPPL